MNSIQKKHWPLIDGEDTSKGVIPAITEGHMGAPALYANTDYSVFQQNPKERGKVLTAKLHHKEELQRYYGKNWKRYLNIPSRSVGIISHVSF